MLSDLLESASHGLGMYPAIAVLIFFAVFVAALWRMLRMDKRYCDQMSAMPLDPDAAANNDPEE